jgi:hypothetical protein
VCGGELCSQFGDFPAEVLVASMGASSLRTRDASEARQMRPGGLDQLSGRDVAVAAAVE